MSNYKITIKTKAELVYYIKSDDINVAIGHALEAPFKEWQVSDFDMPNDNDIDATEIRED
jgi:hypothetical protein